MIDHSKIKCPYCGESYYELGLTMTTSMYYPPIYEDGVNINPDRNSRTTNCKCLGCGKSFIISGNDVDSYEVTK